MAEINSEGKDRSKPVRTESVLASVLRLMVLEGTYNRETLRGRILDASCSVLGVGEPGSQVDDFVGDIHRAERLTDRVMSRVFPERGRR